MYIFISNPLTGTPLSERFQAAQLEERFQELLKPGRAMDFKKSLLERVCVYIYTLWLFNIAMENGPFIDDFPIKTSIYKGFSMAMLNNQMVYVCVCM